MFWRTRRKPVAVLQKYVEALNARDADGMIAQLHRDYCFVDSRGFGIAGREDAAQALQAFFELEQNFRMHIASYTPRQDEVLMQGYTEADDPRLAQDTLWLARVKDGKLHYWQSFCEGYGPALSNILLPEKAVEVAMMQCEIAA